MKHDSGITTVLISGVDCDSNGFLCFKGAGLDHHAALPLPDALRPGGAADLVAQTEEFFSVLGVSTFSLFYDISVSIYDIFIIVYT